MQETLELLRDRPSGDIVRTETDKLIQKVRDAKCTGCSRKVGVNMTEFSDLFASKVEEAVASVCLDLPYTTCHILTFPDRSSWRWTFDKALG